MKKIINRHIVITVMALCLFISCTGDVAYHHFENTPKEGWDVRDSMVFDIDTVSASGTYTTLLCIRASDEYPFQNFCTVTSQTIKPDGVTTSHWSDIRIKEKDGRQEGSGSILFTQEIPLETFTMTKGNSLRIVVRHHMKREVITGIKDVGIKLVKN